VQHDRDGQRRHSRSDRFLVPVSPSNAVLSILSFVVVVSPLFLLVVSTPNACEKVMHTWNVDNVWPDRFHHPEKFQQQQQQQEKTS
jgi:hypothetical protein